ncbi:MAG: hypothetical protein ACR2QG_10675, partial [Gammaproteobacteria bacterium]
LFNTSVLNDAGQVAGASRRYGDCVYCEYYGTYCETYRTQTGESTWLLDGETYVNISPVGYGASRPQFINAAGQVVGRAYSYDCDYGRGRYPTAWFYDGEETIVLNELVGTSTVSYLGEDGLILGYYRFYESGVGTVNRAFVYTPESGMRDLGLIVDESFTQEGWARLASALEPSSNGLIVGVGFDTGTGSQMAYLLTPLETTSKIDIDVKPYDPTNHVRTDGDFKDRFYVSVLGSAGFDATQVDSASLKFGPAEAMPMAHPGAVVDSNRDGFADMKFKFRVADTGLSCDLVDEEVTLTGETNGGLMQFEGTDTVTTEFCDVSCHP